MVGNRCRNDAVTWSDCALAAVLPGAGGFFVRHMQTGARLETWRP